MTGAASLVASAFGPGTTLYDALGGKKKDTQANLKRAYRKSALRFHPDRIHSGQSKKDDGSTKTAEERIRRATHKFQAVSAAYEVLMDPKRRYVYDATGVTGDDDHDNDADDDDDSGSASFPSAPRNGARSKRGRGDVNQQRWEEFFRSIFHEIVTGPAAKHGTAKEYRGSDTEAADVLKYWATCRGDVEKMVLCIVHAESGDGGRWMRDIVDPAIRRGEVVDYDDVNQVSGAKRKSGGGKKNDDSSALVDSDSDDDSIPLGRPKQKRTKKRKKLRKMGSRPTAEEPSRNKKKPRSKRASRGAFSDTDDEKDDEHVVATSSDQASMSKRDKMEYRAAKIRKEQAQRDLEVADIFRSKDWS